MKILMYDCFSGISGDMNLGALLDLGVSADTLLSGLRSLNINGWDLKIEKTLSHGITGTKVTVQIDDHHHDHHHHDHDHDHHHDDHIDPLTEHDHNNECHSNHIHRNLNDIRLIINDSSLNDKVKSSALRIFTRVAEAEAEVHNRSVEEVHFHEVGAVDSIIDIVGAAICLDALGIEKIFVSDVEVGSGKVRCQHGILPVPAPATVKLLKGFNIHHGGVDFEATTPTGAAILAAFAEAAPQGLRYKVLSSGYGIGQKENPHLPNMLRAYLGEIEEGKIKSTNSLMVECNVDDMNPELSDYISRRLFDIGVQDVLFIPVMMKKTRPAFIISIICEEEHLTGVREILFTESTTLGIRVIPFRKEILEREIIEVETRFGRVMVKRSFFNGKLVTLKPEADQCSAIAAANDIPMKEVIREVTEKAYTV